MRFPLSDQLSLRCRFAQLIPGRLHPDGRRYLPLILLELPEPAGSLPEQVRYLAVVDRHHVVDQALVGRQGHARLLFLLSQVRLQHLPYRQGLFDTTGQRLAQASSMPLACGTVLAVPGWEAEQQHLPYESLYVELLLDISVGIVGVRTSMTAASLAEQIGTDRIAPGDRVVVEHSRIDILAFHEIPD